MHTSVAVIRLRRAEYVVPDQCFVLDSRPGNNNATDVVSGTQTLWCRQSGRCDLNYRGRPAGIACGIESYQAEVVGSQRLQTRVLKLARPRQQRIDGHGPSGARFGTKNHVARKPGQITAITVVLWRRPAQYHLAQDLLVGDDGQALRWLGGNVVFQRGCADKGCQFALQSRCIDGSNPVEEGPTITSNRVC